MSDRGLPRVAWFTPLRPVESGISLYNEELLPCLAPIARIDVVTDGYRPSHLIPCAGLRVIDPRRFRAEDARAPYDVVVYQMGNSPAHAYMYPLALERPGIVVLHDTMLHHLVLSMMLQRRGAERYRRLMRERYGLAGAEAAERVIRGQTPPSLFAFPLSEDLIRAARLVVTHSEFSGRQVLGWRPEARVERVPMGIRLPQLLDRRAARASLDLSDDVFVVSSITHVNPYKRMDAVLRAVRRLGQRRAVRLLVAGSVSPAVSIERRIELLGLESRVDLLGYVDDPTARLVAAASDAIVNLRFPTAGETSASLLRSMGSGRPVLVTDAGSFAELPDDAVVKIPADALEEETITAMLEALASRPELAAEIGRRARRFVEREHSLWAMADGYRRILATALGRELAAPVVSEPRESYHFPPPAPSRAADPLLADLGRALVELGLSGDEALTRSAARAALEIGAVPGKMSPAARRDEASGGMPVSARDTQPISPELLEILACPVCKTPVRLEGSKLVCDQCGRRYRIEDGIPIMLIDEAELPDERQ